MTTDTFPCLQLGSEEGIRRAAALLGPGYKGRRATAKPGERDKLLAEVKAAWADAGLGDFPAYLVSASEYRDRRAKLFEVGDYADKGLRAVAEDLQALAAGFDLPVPILIEHVENPLRLGYLTHVEALGPELFGILALTPEADDLLEATGAKSLSLSVSKELDRIYEVSIVGNPRVETARLFCSDYRDGSSAEMNALKREIAANETARVIDGLAQKGVIPPNCVGLAKTLYDAARSRGFAKELEAFLDSLPKAILFGEFAPASDKPRPNATEDELDFYGQHFHDIDIEQILRRRKN